TLSHELRTPMSAILGWLQLARKGVLEGPALDRAPPPIGQNPRPQNQLLNDILDVSRIINGRLHLAVTNVAPLRILQASVDALQPDAAMKRIEIATTID